jgi:hypothetical protein
MRLRRLHIAFVLAAHGQTRMKLPNPVPNAALRITLARGSANVNAAHSTVNYHIWRDHRGVVSRNRAYDLCTVPVQRVSFGTPIDFKLQGTRARPRRKERAGR